MENKDGTNKSYLDRILGELIGLARACENNPKTENTDTVITEALAECIPGNRFSKETFASILGRIQEEKNAVAPNCAACASPCKNTAAYDMEQIQKEKKESRTIKMQLLSETCQMAEFVRKETVSAMEKEKCLELFYKILPMVSYELDIESYLSVLSEINGISKHIKEKFL